MSGVRLRHETARSATLVVETRRKYKAPVLCPTCKTTHLRKTYHLRLDQDGCAIVSEEIVNHLRAAGLPGLTIENVVANPPPQTITIEGLPGQFNLTHQKADVAPLKVMTNRLFKPRVPKE